MLDLYEVIAEDVDAQESKTEFAAFARLCEKQLSSPDLIRAAFAAYFEEGLDAEEALAKVQKVQQDPPAEPPLRLNGLEFTSEEERRYALFVQRCERYIKTSRGEERAYKAFFEERQSPEDAVWTGRNLERAHYRRRQTYSLQAPVPCEPESDFQSLLGMDDPTERQSVLYNIEKAVQEVARHQPRETREFLIEALSVMAFDPGGKQGYHTVNSAMAVVDMPRNNERLDLLRQAAVRALDLPEEVLDEYAVYLEELAAYKKALKEARLSTDEEAEVPPRPSRPRVLDSYLNSALEPHYDYRTASFVGS